MSDDDQKLPGDTQKQQKTASEQIEFVVAEDGLFTTYANHLQVGFTLFDLRIIFGEIVDVAEGKVTVEQRAHVTLSWLQTKFLLALLHKALAQHEARNGEIKLPEGVLTEIDTTTTRGSVIDTVSPA